MELPKEENQLVEIEVTTSPAATYQDLLHAQLGLFESQIEHLENMVITQCELTGVNPLCQEMVTFLHYFLICRIRCPFTLSLSLFLKIKKFRSLIDFSVNFGCLLVYLL